MDIAAEGPRAVKLRSEILTYIVILELVAGLLLAAAMLFEPIPAPIQELRVHGRHTWVTLRIHETKRQGDKYVIPYEFKGSGRTYIGQEVATSERFQSASFNNTEKVWFLPDRPEASTTQYVIDSHEKRAAPRGYLFLMAGLLGTITVAWRAYARRERSMLRDWTAINVKVSSIDQHLHLLVPGARGTAALSVPPLKNTLPAVGQELVLLRNPEAPSQVRLVEDLRFVEVVQED